MAEQKQEAPVTVVETKYKKNPLLRFQQGEDDFRALQFGLGKARRLLAFAKANGADALLNKLEEFVQKHSKDEDDD
jgi:hypothetical protein